MVEAVTQRCSVKKAFLEILQNSQENTCVRVSFLIKLKAACNFIKKETLTRVLSCEFCEISKNTFSWRTPPVAASTLELSSFLLTKQLLSKKEILYLSACDITISLLSNNILSDNKGILNCNDCNLTDYLCVVQMVVINSI